MSNESKTEPASPFDDDDPAAGDSLGEVLDAYLRAMETGRPIDPALLAAIRPDIADRLRACLAVLDATRCPLAADGESPAARLGDFALIRPLARGGMGVVFEATQISLRRRVAVKVLPLAAGLDPVRLGRFQVEARAAAMLHHTNIVPVYSVGCDRGVHYYAMQYIEGRTLAELIRDLRGDPQPPGPDEPPPTEAFNGVDPASAPSAPPPPAPPRGAGPAPLPPDPTRHRRAAEWGARAADALEHAHRAGVLHRDVKPSNLMIDRDGGLWITDFGLARLEADVALTIAGDLIGTLCYMSPEQSIGDPSRIDFRTDVYSLGATLYELLALRPPRASRDRNALLVEIANEEPPSPRSIDRTIPRDLETIIEKAMARAPADRYSSAGAMAEDLRRFLDDRPILARRPSPFTLVARWVGRRKAGVATVALTAMLLIASLTALALALHNREMARIQRRADYARDVAQAGRQVRLNDLGEAARLLFRHLPRPGGVDERGFAWHFLWRLCHVAPERVPGHRGDVYHVEYSPDGRAFATAGEDGTVRLWSADGSPLRVFRGHDGDVDWATFSPDGRMIASCGDDGSILLWDADDDSIPPRVLARADVEIVAVVFTPDGRSLIAGDDAGVLTSRTIDRDAPIVLRRFEDRIGALAIDPGGRYLAVAVSQSTPRPPDTPPGGFHVVDLLDSAGDAVDSRLASGQSAAISADGGTAAAVGYAGMVRIATLGERGVAFRSDRIPSNVNLDGVGFSPDARIIVGCGRGGRVLLWDARTGTTLRTLLSPASRCWSVAFSPDGRRLAAACDDGCVDLWNLDANHPELAFTTDPIRVDPISSPSAGESRFAWLRHDAERGLARLVALDVRTGEASESPPFPIGRPTAAAVADDGETVAILDADEPGIVRVRGSDGVARTLEFPPNRKMIAPGRRPPKLVFDPGGSRLAAWMFDGRVIDWDLATGRATESPLRAVSSLVPVHSPDGSRLAMVDGDILKIWEPAAGRVVSLPRGRQGAAAAVAFSADGHVVAVAAESQAVALWNLDQPNAPPRIVNDLGKLRALAFAPNGLLLACADEGGETAILDLDSQRVILKLDAPRSRFSLLRFSADGGELRQLGWSDGEAAVLAVWIGRP